MVWCIILYFYTLYFFIILSVLFFSFLLLFMLPYAFIVSFLLLHPRAFKTLLNNTERKKFIYFFFPFFHSIIIPWVCFEAKRQKKKEKIICNIIASQHTTISERMKKKKISVWFRWKPEKKEKHTLKYTSTSEWVKEKKTNYFRAFLYV